MNIKIFIFLILTFYMIAMEFTKVFAFNGTLSDSTYVENKTKIFNCYQDSL